MRSAKPVHTSLSNRLSNFEPRLEAGAIADLVLCAAGAALQDLPSGLLAAAALRFGVVLNALVNEWGHVAVAAGLGAHGEALRAANLLGHRSPFVHLSALVPFTADRRGDLTVEVPSLDARQTRVARRGGFWAGSAASLVLLAVLGALVPAAAPALALAFVAYAAGCLLALCGAFVSDLTELTPYAHLRGVMACGNVTLIGRLLPGETSALPARGRELLEGMLRISQMRGAQSGGGAMQVRRRGVPRQLLRKCVNPKRGDLAKRLADLLGKAARSSRSYGASFLVQAHVRYATAGSSTVDESHPFHYLDAARRGARRIVHTDAPEMPPSVRPVETALSHNGDLDAVRWRGVRLGYEDFGRFLERVLDAPNRFRGDSPMLAGALELFVTRGMWLESLRLAYHLHVAALPPDAGAIAEEFDGAARARTLRAAFSEYPAPARGELLAWAEAAEQEYCEAGGAPSDARERRLLAERIAARLGEDASVSRPDFLIGMARTAVDAFLDNDLYRAVKTLEPLLEGTFGCVMTSSLEPGAAVVLSRGQPISLGFEDELGLVAIVSERAALKVRRDDGLPMFAERLDLELGLGEVARVEVRGEGAPLLAVHDVARNRELSRGELEAAGRIVALRGNAYVTPLPPDVEDRASRDVADILPVLQRVRASWENPMSRNVKTADAFAKALLGRRDPAVLVVGMTNDLWLAEQFVHNLKTVFPRLRAEARSGNAVLKDPDRFPIDPDTIVLVVSQSGQDFPTLGSLLLLKQRLDRYGNDSLFVLTSEFDTLMGQFVGQSYAKGAPFCRRILSNQSGFRPSESATVSVNATHHTFVELLLFVVSRALDRARHPVAPLGFALTRRDLSALFRRRDVTVDRHAPDVVGARGNGAASHVAERLGSHARRWKWHVLEGAVAFVAAVGVLELNLQFGLALEPSGLLALARAVTHGHTFGPVADVVATQANVLFYAFLAPLLVWLLRCAQRRPALHRQGTRELLIGDTRYVHRIAWFLARKLFSLSYGFASIKPYSADSQDDLVLAHEPVRGTLALFGIPDARRRHLQVRAAAATMTAKQFWNSRSLGGAGAEVVTIGHGSSGVEGCQAHYAIPADAVEESSALVDTLVEDLFDSWDRLLAMQLFLDDLSRGISKFGPFRYDRSRTKDQVFAPTTASPVSAASVYELFSRGAAKPAAKRPSFTSTLIVLERDGVRVSRVQAVVASDTVRRCADA